MLLGAPGIATRNKKLLGAPGLTTRSKDATLLGAYRAYPTTQRLHFSGGPIASENDLAGVTCSYSHVPTPPTASLTKGKAFYANLSCNFFVLTACCRRKEQQAQQQPKPFACCMVVHM